MDPWQQNFVSEVMMFAEDAVKLKNRADDLIARYFANDFDKSLTDTEFVTPIDDLQKRGPFPHLTQAKFQAAISAIQTFQAALGDKASGEQVNLIKMKG